MSVEELGRCVENENEPIAKRMSSCFLLKQLGTEDAIDALAKGLGSQSVLLKHEIAYVMGQMKLTKPQAANAAELFGLSKAETAMLNETPMRGMPMPPTDPLIYRFYELVMVNGPAWKALIEEEYGDGIMSAIDFDMVMERLPNPKGDRVKITMSGKFLPYKYYGASGNVPEYGFKEE